MILSVIIPTLNEEKYLISTIEHLRRASNNEHEIIVVDSGSSDGTCDIARSLALRLIQCDSNSLGKSHNLNQAAGLAAGDVLLFLDADTLVPADFDKLIESSLLDTNVVGGAFEFTLDGPEFGLRVVELINRTRYRVRQRFYGDQGIFVRTEMFKRVGGYPEIPLLESAYLCRNLRRQGKLKLIKKEIKTSPRRFIDGGIYRVLWGDIKIWFLDVIGMSVSKYADPYWKENKSRSKH